METEMKEYVFGGMPYYSKADVEKLTEELKKKKKEKEMVTDGKG